MRIVLDTNVWLAAFLTHGRCQELVEYCLESHALFVSSFLLKEIEEKLAKKLRFPADKVLGLVRFVAGQCQLVQEAKLGKRICRDPDDDHIIATALGAKAHCLVSGDKDLQDLKRVGPIVIVSPADFWRWEKEGTRGTAR